MHTKISLLIFISSFYACLSFGQKNKSCDYDIDKNDPKTGAIVRSIKTKLTGTDIFYFITTRNDTSYTIKLNFWISGTLRESVEKNDKAVFKLSGGEVLTLYALSSSRPIPHFGDQVWTEYFIEYPVLYKDLEKIKNFKPLQLSLQIGKEPFQRTFNEKDIERIVTNLKCILMK